MFTALSTKFNLTRLKLGPASGLINTLLSTLKVVEKLSGKTLLILDKDDLEAFHEVCLRKRRELGYESTDSMEAFQFSALFKKFDFRGVYFENCGVIIKMLLSVLRLIEDISGKTLVIVDDENLFTAKKIAFHSLLMFPEDDEDDEEVGDDEGDD